MNINSDFILKTVVFIYAADPQGQPDTNRPLGTGFIVRVPLVSDPTKAYLVLVTARHMIDPAWAFCPDQQPAKLFARLNVKNYDPKKDETGVEYVPIYLRTESRMLWKYTPEDDAADVAVTLLDAKQFAKYDLAGVAISEFATEDEAAKLAPSDPIVSAGLLA